MTKQTTQMNHPYELFAYQVGQDMKSLIARIEALETQPHGENTPPTTSGQISVLELRTIAPSAICYPEDEAKLASGDYVVDTNNTDLVIQVGKQYAGWEVNGVKRRLVEIAKYLYTRRGGKFNVEIASKRHFCFIQSY